MLQLSPLRNSGTIQCSPHPKNCVKNQTEQCWMERQCVTQNTSEMMRLRGTEEVTLVTVNLKLLRDATCNRTAASLLESLKLIEFFGGVLHRQGVYYTYTCSFQFTQ